MEYEKRINDLLKATEVLLESNRDLGERLADSRKQLESCLLALKKSEEEKKNMRGEIEQLKHALYGKRSEKGSNASSLRKNKTKKEAESEYIKSGSKKPETKAAEIADDDDDGVDEDTTPGSPASGGQPTPQWQKGQGTLPESDRVA